MAEAAEFLGEIAPSYPTARNDPPVEICAEGERWFFFDFEAIADAIFRYAKHPGGRNERLGHSDWRPVQNERGLWAVLTVATNCQ